MERALREGFPPFKARFFRALSVSPFVLCKDGGILLQGGEQVLQISSAPEKKAETAAFSILSTG
jgi:hypothetical protein